MLPSKSPRILFLLYKVSKTNTPKHHHRHRPHRPRRRLHQAALARLQASQQALPQVAHRRRVPQTDSTVAHHERLPRGRCRIKGLDGRHLPSETLGAACEESTAVQQAGCGVLSRGVISTVLNHVIRSRLGFPDDHYQNGALRSSAGLEDTTLSRHVTAYCL